MSMKLHYSRSPLTEAIIDLRVDLPDAITLETLAQIQVGQEGSYPTRRDSISLQGQISNDPNIPPVTLNRAQNGYAFVSKDEHQVAQARLDGFTFSRLAPYQSWASFRDEAQLWWTIYRKITQPEAILRVAVRYINRLDLPLPLSDFKDYLRIVPEVSPDLPRQGLSGYFMQLHIPQDDLGAMLFLSEALVQPLGPDNVSVILDIDLFRQVDPPDNEADIWAYFEQLRLRKNEIFEASLTEKMKELIR